MLSTNLISGVSSGFDWRTMVDQLIEIEHARVDLVDEKKATYQKKLTEWQSFNTMLLELKTAAEELKDPEDFLKFTSGMVSNSSTIDAEDLLSISTSSNASVGSYSIKITNLAKAQKLSSNPFTSQNTALGSSYAGDMLINGEVVTISATDTLLDVASKINTANTGSTPSRVTASVVNYGANDYRLILTSDDTGEEGISLLNGSSSNVLQKFGWKDNTTAIVKNSITNGAQSDLFTTHSSAIKSLLGLTTGEDSTGTLTINGTAVYIDLASQSLTDIKNTINGAGITGVSASIVSKTVDDETFYLLQIDGTQTFEDEKNILNTLGILDHTSVDVTGKVSANSMTEEGAYITSSTLLTDIDGYNTFTPGGYSAGDYITLSGDDTEGLTITPVNISISASTTVQDLLDQIESSYGDIVAYVTSTGNIRVDDLTGGSSLSVSIASTIQDVNSDLTFGAFDAGAARKREAIAGEDAVVLIDGVEVKSSSNVIEDVIEGVSLDLVNENSDTTITLNVGRDTDSIKENINLLVDKYNSVISFIDSQFDYNEDAEETGGVLFGDGTLRSIRSDLVNSLITSVWGVNEDFSALTLVGIENSVNDENNLSLTVDDTKLTENLRTNFNDIMSLFIGQGTTSVNSLTYIGHTMDSESGEYTVHINRAATQGSETGNIDLTGGGAEETLTISKGNNTASISITSGMSTADIVNTINSELETEYAQIIVGDESLYSDNSQNNEITSETKWGSIYNDSGSLLGFSNGDTITFSGTTRSGGTVSGSYSISDINNDKVQGLLSSIEDAFSSDVTASIDSSGRIVISDKYNGYSQVSLDSVNHNTEGEFFGTIDVGDGSGDGSQAGRYKISVTASNDGSGNLVLTNDDYGSGSFTISQDNTDNNYNHISYTETANTTNSSNGTVYITSSTAWNDISGASLAVSDTINITGYARDGSTPITGSYTITNLGDTIGDLLTQIETAFSGQGTTVDAFIKDGKIYVEDQSSGSSSISLTLTPSYGGGGNGLTLGTFDQTTERDLDLGLINETVTGQDVAGTIGGEAATGTGQVLKGSSDNVNTDGISVMYSGSSNDIDAGSIKLTIGVADLFNRKLYNITDSIDGYLAFKMDSLQNSITGFDDQIYDMEERLDSKMEQMINRFVQMELALTKIQNQSSWLSSQISAAASGWG